MGAGKKHVSLVLKIIFIMCDYIKYTMLGKFVGESFSTWSYD